MFGNIYKDKTVIVTGHTGFKGSWLTLWLKMLGANVVGISNDLVSSPSHFKVGEISNFVDDFWVDIRDLDAITKIIGSVRPDFIFHLAAQALVRPSYDYPVDTLTTNAIGSVNVLEAIRIYEKSVIVVMITSDKVYENFEWIWGYRETDKIGGKDPYSASKGMAELAIKTYLSSYFNDPTNGVRLAVARAGNVIGGGDWAMDRIVPDCMRAWAVGDAVEIRSSKSTRPWQHVLEPVSGYLVLGEALASDQVLHGQAYNFGPAARQNFSVEDLICEMNAHWKNVRWKDVSKDQQQLYEAGLLKLNCDKAAADLHWEPVLEFAETVALTVQWYRSYYEDNPASMSDFSLSQISRYGDLAETRNLKWARSY